MIRKVLVYISLVVLALNGIRALMDIGIRKNKAGVFEKYNTMFLKSNDYNVLFMGSSRAETHFNTAIFDSATGLNSYNIGVTGATPRIAYKVLKAYCLKSKLPEYLIFDVDLHFLKYGVDTIHHFPRYFPYLENDILLNEFNQIDNRFMSFKYNPFYSLPFSNFRLLSASLHGWFDIPGKYDSCYHKGFAKIFYKDELERATGKNFYGYFHPTERSYLDSIIQFSKENKIRLMLVTSPMFKEGITQFLNKVQVVKQIKNIANINGLEYDDFSEFPLSNDRKYFVDYFHMTPMGADLFTRQFSRHFSQYFDKKTVN